MLDSNDSFVVFEINSYYSSPKADVPLEMDWVGDLRGVELEHVLLRSSISIYLNGILESQADSHLYRDSSFTLW